MHGRVAASFKEPQIPASPYSVKNAVCDDTVDPGGSTYCRGSYGFPVPTSNFQQPASCPLVRKWQAARAAPAAAARTNMPITPIEAWQLVASRSTTQLTPRTPMPRSRPSHVEFYSSMGTLTPTRTPRRSARSSLVPSVYP